MPPASAVSKALCQILSQTAADINSLFVIPLPLMEAYNLFGDHLVPLVSAQDKGALNALPYTPKMIEMTAGTPSFSFGYKPVFQGL